MVGRQVFADRKEFSCELCGENFWKNYGMAENHETWDCEVGHEVRSAFRRGEIESPLSGKLRREKETEKEKDRRREVMKLSKMAISKFSTLRGEIKKAKKSVSSRLLNNISNSIFKYNLILARFEYIK